MVAHRAFTKNILGNSCLSKNAKCPSGSVSGRLIFGKSKRLLLLDKEKSLNLLVKLGFTVNLEKSSLIPSQSVTSIGVLFLLDKGLVCPTLERILKINQAILTLKKEMTAQLPSAIRFDGIMH